MNRNFVFDSSTQALPTLLQELAKADEVGSRAGRTRELTHVGITLTRPWERELLLLNRKHSLAAQIAETMWVLAGRDDVEWLARYLPRAVEFSDDGITWRGAYGRRLRHWGLQDQIAHVVETLRADPLSRQAVAMVYNPAVDSQPGKDIPCNDAITFLSRLGKLDMHVFVRSNDVMWGWSGINAFEWSALQEVVAGLLGLRVGSLHFSITSLHLYDRHWAKAERIAEAPGLEVVGSPRFSGIRTLEHFDQCVRAWLSIEESIRGGEDMHHEINAFPEPMLQSWLRVIEWWWTGNAAALEPLKGARLWASAQLSVQPKALGDPFLDYVNRLHAEKHAAYGDSWKRRGEMLGILANIARKVDRLCVGGATSDETPADTAVDLLVYLAKYRCWLADPDAEVVAAVEDLLFKVTDRVNARPDLLYRKLDSITQIEQLFSRLEYCVSEGLDRVPMVDELLDNACVLARSLWYP